MPTPDRPVEGAEIETAWGQEVHDRTFAPKGCRVHGGAVTLPGDHSTVILDLSSVDSDPGGWLDAANDRLEAPADSGGLYSLACRISSTGGEDPDDVRAAVYVNGAEVSRQLEQCATGAQITIALGAGLHLELTPGDLVTIRALKVGSSGPNPSASVTVLSVLRLANEYGA